MIERETWERLSRLREGELPDEEAKELRRELGPALEAALAELDRLDTLAAGLPSDLDAVRAERIVRSTLVPRRRSFRVLGIAAAFAAVLGGAVLLLRDSSAPPVVVAIEGPLTRTGTELATGPEATALVAVEGGMVLVGQNSRVHLEEPIRLDAGTIAAWGRALELATDQAEIRLDGTGLLSWEPPDALDRATGGRRLAPEGGTMRLWGKIGPAAAGALAGAAFTLLVIDGRAVVRTSSAAAREPTRPIEVAAGERVTVSVAGSASRAALASHADVQQKEAIAARDEGTTREALLAEVERLREEREALVRKTYALERALASKAKEGASPRERGTYYRIPQEELLAHAAEGRLRLRLPHVHTPPGSRMWADEVNEDLRLTPEEQEAIRQVYADSSERIRQGLASLYVEIGGDPLSVVEMDALGLFQALQQRSHEDELREAVRVAARERAGLVAVGAGGTPIVRAFRLLWREDHRVVEEIERILGPERARRFLDHERTSHADAEFRVGPEE